MEALLGQLVPVITAGVVYGLVAGIKSLKRIKFSENKKKLLRPVAGVLSLAGVVTLSLVTGADVPQDQIVQLADILVNTALGYIGATGIHELRNG